MTQSDHALAERLARETGVLLTELLEAQGAAKDWRLEQTADRLAHEFLMDELGRHRPADAVLSEEGSDDRSRLNHDRLWIVDPLDGSSDFGFSGAWCVHVALCEGGTPAAGAVAVPAWDTTFTTDPPSSPAMCGVGRRRVVVARSRGYIDGRRLADALDVEVLTLGSAGVKAMLTVRGEVDAYVHGGGLYEWDTCAPAAVALAAGLHVSAADGSPLSFNNRRPVSPGLVICRRDFADELLAALRSFS